MKPDDRGRRYWDRNAKHYDRSMSLLGKPMPRLVALAAEGVTGAARVLEVAAGTGLVTTALANFAKEVVATDYSEAMTAKLTERVRELGLTNVRCEHADIYALQYEDGYFDAVVAANVLHLLQDLSLALAALKRVTKPQGRLIVPTYCHDETLLSGFISRALAVTGFPGQERFSLASLVQAVEGAGLKVTRTELLQGILPIGYVEGSWS